MAASIAPFIPLIIAVITPVLGYLLGRQSATKRLIKVSDRQAKELVMLGQLVIDGTHVTDMLVDALHDKGVLNGNACEIKQGLQKQRESIMSYLKKSSNETLYFEKE